MHRRRNNRVNQRLKERFEVAKREFNIKAIYMKRTKKKRIVSQERTKRMYC